MRNLLRHKRAIAASLAVLGIGLTATYAAFTDTAETTATITAAGVDIVVNNDVTDGTPVQIPIDITAQPDGKTTWTSDQQINIHNASAQPITVSVAAPTVTDLAGSGLAGQIDAAFTTFPSESVNWVGGEGPLSAVGAKASNVAIAANQKLTIAAGGDAPITLELATPGGLSNTYQNASAKLDWVITATVA